uniref:Flavin-containing monooxygenase n=1 Tax=Caenorhabditis japonica TaxID=281687 RepID=A0A8R1EEP5_CAEJA
MIHFQPRHRTDSKLFDGVMLCSGHHALPHIPKAWPGQEKFKGRIVHSHDYKDYKGYEDRVVVVVGIGNSGADCAVELSRISKQVYLVTRRGSWIFNRLFDRGVPLDLWFNSAHPTVNDELPNRIACGTVRVKPGIQSFTENSIIFEDGSRVENVDEVILATGFSFHFNMIEKGNLVKVDENQSDIFKYMFPIATADHNSLAVIGLVQPVGSIMPISEMQARVYLESFAAGHKLPSRDK